MPIQIIIPMSGYGERFKKAGYKIPKALIKVEGKPIIAHVIDLFPGEKKFFFICNKNHIRNKKWRLKKIIQKYAPTGKIISIDPHKLGPIYAVNQVYKFLDLNLPTIINYCDFTCYWDWKLFKNKVLSNSFDGAIPAYRGFHPHSSGVTNYAYIKQKKFLLEDIQEKKPFTRNKINEFTSSGTYFFSSAKLMYEAFNYVKKKKLHIKKEFYVSLAYKYLLKNNKKTLIYPLKYFMQWGTPQDLEEYKYYSDLFKNLIKNNNSPNSIKGTNIIPMAGLGNRFKKEKYKIIKPLIPVMGKPMCLMSMQSLPKSNKNLFVLRSKIKNNSNVINKIKNENSFFKIIDKKTNGQAITVKIGLEYIKKNKKISFSSPYTVGTCDSAILYDKTIYNKLVKNKNTDVIIWVKSKYPYAFKNPKMYSWIKYKNNKIIKTSIKKPFNKVNKKNDLVITGIFTFKNINHAIDSINQLILRNKKINGEYYMDSCIDIFLSSGLKCKIIDVESYISWGTPTELKIFNYWFSCFKIWKSHPYSLSKRKNFL